MIVGRPGANSPSPALHSAAVELLAGEWVGLEGRMELWNLPWPSVRPPAMTVAPSNPSSADQGPAESAQDRLARSFPADGTPPAWLTGDLQARVHQVAHVTGMTAAAVCERWVREGLERFEALQTPELLDGSGRCSLRTGTSSIGPVPLPVQQ